MRVARLLLVLGLLFFLTAVRSAYRLTSGEGSSETELVIILIIAVITVAAGSWRMHRSVDWDRIDAEQRLWESGPLARRWLRIRKGLFWND